MDGSLAGTLSPAPALFRATPGASFGEAKQPARALDPGMGLAVARRTVFRDGDGDDFGRVADRVAAGNMALLGTRADPVEQARLRNAIACGALLTSGRHLQHGDADQPGRNMEVFTNCATAITSFTLFYLLLNGSGVGRAYDDELVAVDWGRAPRLLLRLDPAHADFPDTREELHRFGAEFGLLPWGSTLDAFDAAQEDEVRAWIAREFLRGPAPEGAMEHLVADSREGWGKAVELLESLAFEGAAGRTLLLDFSAIRPRGAPIGGMQGRPASGPLSLIRAFVNLRHHVIEPARHRAPGDEAMQPWEQALLVDHHLSVEVQVGGARRAARMATKSWRDPGIFRFIRAKSEGGLWTANNSVMVDREFWAGVGAARAGSADPLHRHALAVFDEATRCGFINGEPGFINGDRLEDHRTGTAWRKPVHDDGRDVRSGRYQATHAVSLLAALSERANAARFPATTNPCGEISLHVTGGYCVIADFAPLLACPVDLANLFPGDMADDVAARWDARVEDSVRLAVRFLMRANTMDALYAEEVRRTNRIGVGPTGLQEWAWMRFGLSFDDLLDEARGAPFWRMLSRLSDAAKQEAEDYAAEIGQAVPFTVTTVKPAGTTSKLFGLTEGAHLPARRQYLRWVQFKGTRDPAGRWHADADRLLADYESRGYPVRELRSFPGMAIVGFPTLPLIQRLGIGERIVTAPEATPEQQYRWLRLIERHWIGAERGNQVSYTLKLYTDRHDIDSFRDLLLEEQPRIRCCSILPSRPDHELGYEYLPEEEISFDRFVEVVEGITDAALHEAIDLAHLQCASGVCPM
ncbi:recombinase [Falsiroseomonas sp. CW058]|uniref:recombinase n=1 Tax=Falsiroseomonas sp. CW058 TaxID=3388664 RepID=UPI003D317D4B